MSTEQFTPEVEKALGHYVYRLIDPRNGETFYVGKGQGNRVFAHVSGALKDSDESVADPKLERIREIRDLGMNVEHVIHRHGMTTVAATEVEAALIDAYPGLTNKVAGSGVDRGSAHAKEIMIVYGAREFVLQDKLILNSIANTWKERGVYGGVRGLWKMSLQKASQYNLVLAHVRGLVLGPYKPTRWMYGEGNESSFPYEDWDSDGSKALRARIGFDGRKAKCEVWNRYVLKRIPAKHRPKRGAMIPFRYLHPD